MRKYMFPTKEEMSEIQSHVLRKKNKDVADLQTKSLQWIRCWWGNKMDYEVNWFGIPILQNPTDIVLLQELIYTVSPDIIIEAGIAHGGSLLLYSSYLELLGKGEVIGIDVDIRGYNKKLLLKHPFIKRVKMFQGSSTDPRIVKKVKERIKPGARVMVVLDSDHSYGHVYNELKTYKDIVTPGSYFVVCDTFMINLKGVAGAKDDVQENNPMRAVEKFIKENKNFEIDTYYNKFFVSSNPNGFLKKIA